MLRMVSVPPKAFGTLWSNLPEYGMTGARPYRTRAWRLTPTGMYRSRFEVHTNALRCPSVRPGT
jgi:hypothetical protein